MEKYRSIYVCDSWQYTLGRPEYKQAYNLSIAGEQFDAMTWRSIFLFLERFQLLAKNTELEPAAKVDRATGLISDPPIRYYEGVKLSKLI